MMEMLRISIWNQAYPLGRLTGMPRIDLSAWLTSPEPIVNVVQRKRDAKKKRGDGCQEERDTRDEKEEKEEKAGRGSGKKKYCTRDPATSAQSGRAKGSNTEITVYCVASRRLLPIH